LTAGVSLRHAHAHSAFGRATLLRIFDALAAATDAVGYAKKQWKLFQNHRRGNNKVGNIKVDAGFVDVTSVCKPRLALAVVWIVRTREYRGDLRALGPVPASRGGGPSAQREPSRNQGSSRCMRRRSISQNPARSNPVEFAGPRADALSRRADESNRPPSREEPLED
jgi:hypothetical protein